MNKEEYQQMFKHVLNEMLENVAIGRRMIYSGITYVFQDRDHAIYKRNKLIVFSEFGNDNTMKNSYGDCRVSNCFYRGIEINKYNWRYYNDERYKLYWCGHSKECLQERENYKMALEIETERRRNKTRIKQQQIERERYEMKKPSKN